MNDTLTSDKNKKLYIHIGYPKTGTTAIQTFLAINNHQLRALGFDYAVPGRTYASHQNLAFELLDPDLYRPELGGWEELVDYIHRSPQTGFLISAEHLYRALDPEIKTVMSWLKGIEVQIIVYLRPQAEIIQSIYLQSIREGVIRTSWEQFFNGRLDEPYYQYFDVLKRWENNGAAIASVRIYDFFRFRDENIYDDFLMALGIERTADELLFEKPVGQLNEMPGAKSMALLYELCKHPAFAAASRERRYQAQEMIAGLCTESGWSLQKANLLTREQVLSSNAHFAQQNASVATHYFNIKADEPLFSDDHIPADEQQSVGRFTDQDWIDIIVRLALIASK